MLIMRCACALCSETMEYVSKKRGDTEKEDFDHKFKKSLIKALDMNVKIPDVQITKDKLGYKGISPYKWIIIFVGSTRYGTDVFLDNYMNKDLTNLNLIIVGINITH